MTEDEKEIKKAKEDIAEKGKDSQTEKDRVDESVGAQEKNSDNENSQDAKDRVDESEGTKKADEERAEDKQEREEQKEEKSEDFLSEKILSAITNAVNAAVEKAVGNAFNALDRQSKEAGEKDSAELQKIENLYN